MVDLSMDLNDHPEEVIRRIVEVCGNDGPGRQVLRDAGVELFMGFGLPRIEAGTVPSYSANIESVYKERDVSLAAGLFLVIGREATFISRLNTIAMTIGRLATFWSNPCRRYIRAKSVITF